MSVYFITARKIGLVKIGYTNRDLEHRIAALRTSCPAKLKLEACIPGGIKEERELHKRFVQCRTHGEWFKLTPELSEFIRGLGITDDTEEPIRVRARSEKEMFEEIERRSKETFEEAMRDFAALGPITDTTDYKPTRFYNPAPSGCGCFNRHFGARGGGRRLCDDMHLTWDQADRLCDVLEEVRRDALELPTRREKAA